MWLSHNHVWRIPSCNTWTFLLWPLVYSYVYMYGIEIQTIINDITHVYAYSFNTQGISCSVPFSLFEKEYRFLYQEIRNSAFCYCHHGKTHNNVSSTSSIFFFNGNLSRFFLLIHYINRFNQLRTGTVVIKIAMKQL